MELRLLGPLELWAGDRAVDLGQPRQRAVLAALAADVGRLVTVDALVDRVWDDAPPGGARSALYAHVSRIRRLLEDTARIEAGSTGRPPLRLTRRSGGYVLEAEEDRVDLVRFRRLVARARDAHRDDTDRSELLREALDLWRGTPLAGLAGGWADRMRTAWSHERLDAAIAWTQAELRAGRPREVIGRVRALTAEYPLSEPLAAVLVQALAAAGRSAEALDFYALVRRTLADELGTEPGAELRAAHEAVLRGAFVAPAGERPPSVKAAPSARPVPAQLPADVSAFTGRADQLAELSARLIASGSREASTAVVVSAVSGTAGVGKTALAVRWAHTVRHEFPDGQLYVNLRGYDTKEPVSAADALAGFLSALGVPGQDIPLELDERSARYRTELTGQRLLIVLDNASSTEQVRPLLPGTSACKVVVTSRDSLAGLVAVHGAHRLVLDMLPPADAISLLRALIGARVDAEPDAAAVLAEQCGRLPLALRVAAELALSQPAASLSGLVDELADQRDRLDLLDADGDPRAAVRAVFSWSYERLPAEAASVFRLLGLHPGPDFDAYAAAALAGEPIGTARRILALLTRAHLIQPTRPGRHGMHDLLRAYAAWQAEVHDTEADREAALTRLFDHHLAGAAAAMDVLHPGERALRPSVPPPATALPPLTHAAQARDWLNTEHPVLMASCIAAADRGRAGHTTRIALTLHRHFDSGGHFTDALTVYARARRSAQQAGDRQGEADVLTNLGIIHRRLAQYEAAAECHEQAMALYRRIGHRTGEGRNLTNLGVIHELRGQYRPAADRHEQAMVLFREIGDRSGQADALNNLGIISELLHDYERSADHHRQALALYRALGHTFGEASALGNLGIVLGRLGDHTAAADHFEQTLALFRRLGHRGGEAHALTNLGDTCTKLAQYETAADHHHSALALFRGTGERYGEAGALNGLGEALLGSDRRAQALAAHTSALSIATEINEQEEQSRAHIGLARIHESLGDPDRARNHWRCALDLYTALGSPRAAEVRDCLNALDRTRPHGESR